MISTIASRSRLNINGDETYSFCIFIHLIRKYILHTKTFCYIWKHPAIQMRQEQYKIYPVCTKHHGKGSSLLFNLLGLQNTDKRSVGPHLWIVLLFSIYIYIYDSLKKIRSRLFNGSKFICR